MTDIERHVDNNLSSIDWSTHISGSDMLPKQYHRKPANLMYAAEYADALGVSRIHVLTSIAVINGRPSPSADLMASMVRKHGHRLRVRGDDTYATVELIRKDDPDFTFTAHWDEAKARKAGLWGNRGPWTQYPGAMLRARAISEVVRMGAQDVMAGGIYTPEELGATVDADGVPVESERVDQPAPTSRTRPQVARSNRDAAMQALQPEPAVADMGDDELAAIVERIEQSTDKDELRGLYNEVKGNQHTDMLHELIVSRVQDLDQQASHDAPVDAEIVDEDAA